MAIRGGRRHRTYLHRVAHLQLLFHLRRGVKVRAAGGLVVGLTGGLAVGLWGLRGQLGWQLGFGGVDRV